MPDSPIVADGDAGFIGFASRLNPVTLPSGMLQDSVNMRLDRGVAQTRKGAKRLADDISPGEVPLTLPLSIDAGAILRASYSGGIFGSAVLRSPDEVNSMEVIVLASSDRAYTVLLDGSIQVSTEWSEGFLTDESGNEIVTDTLEEIVTSKLPASIPFPSAPSETIEETDTVTMLQAYDRLYVLREADPTVAGWGEKSLTVGGITVISTTATVNCASHGFLAGQRVRLEGSSVAAFSGHEYDIQTVAGDGNSFTITVPSGTANDTTLTGRTVRRVKPPIYWTGDPAANFVRSDGNVPAEGPTYKTLRSVGWASYINGRLLIPDGRDQVAVSDLANPNLFDPYWASFKANQGSNDYIVAIHPWVEGSVLVFMRRSIWLAEVNELNVANGNDTLLSRLTILTDEIGCSARRSIATAGQYVYFLSDAGVYRLDSRLDLKLRGDTKPLSEPIADKLANIDASNAKNAVGLWFNNRYYLAVQERGQSNQQTVYIYNALNEAWETKDVLPAGVDNFLVAAYEDERRVFASSREGKLFLLEEQEDGDDPSSGTVTSTIPVAGSIRTRRFGGNNLHNKRFIRTMADCVLPAGSTVTLKASLLNPDDEVEIGSQTNSNGSEEDYSVKAPIRRRAHAADIIFNTTAGRPQIRSVQIEAATATMAQAETRNAA
jgi:hypothetical protein